MVFAEFDIPGNQGKKEYCRQESKKDVSLPVRDRLTEVSVKSCQFIQFQVSVIDVR